MRVAVRLVIMNLKDISSVVSDDSVVRPETHQELKGVVRSSIRRLGNNADLNFIDTSLITNMSSLFEFSDFNGDISQWDVSSVENMSLMFSGCEFNGDLSKWDVSKVRDMGYMFNGSKFNNDSLSGWNVSKVLDMRCMFEDSYFNGDVSRWDVSNVRDCFGIFYNSDFKGDLSKWKLKSVYDNVIGDVYLQLKPFGLSQRGVKLSPEQKFLLLDYDESDMV